MSETNKKKEEYSLILYLIIFFVIVSLVGFSRLLIILSANDGKSKIDLSYIDASQYSASDNITNVNLSIKNILEKHYGVDIYYGESTKVIVKSVEAKELIDNKETFNMLKQVYDTLSKYPVNIINEIENKGYRVSIYLVDFFNNSNAALANRNSNGEFNIYISRIGNFERTLHHEVYHILDYYIKLEEEEEVLYKNWEKYNPEGFKYTGNVEFITSNHVYTTGVSGASFVSAYAKYAQKEDRAETFAQMMIDMQREVYYNEGEKIREKIDIISKVLKNTFVTVNQAEEIHWERYL